MSDRTFDDFTGRTIDAGRLFLQSILGRGGHAVVYKAIDIIDPARPAYAVKWLGLPTHSRMRPDKEREHLDQLDAEYYHHARVADHPNVLTLHRIIDDTEFNCKWIVLDYCPGGDLFTAITERNPFWLNDERTRSICLQLVDAIAYCHARGIYHRDIKPENIMISEDCNTIYLCDFGLATTDAWCTHALGTSGYNAPERLDEDFRLSRDMGAYSCALGDVWSIAITFFNILTGHPPWKCARLHCEDSACVGFLAHAFDPSANYHRFRFPLSVDMHRVFRDAVALEPTSRLDLCQLRARLLHAKVLYPTPQQIEAQFEAHPHTEARMARVIAGLYDCADEWYAYEDELVARRAAQDITRVASPDFLETPRVAEHVVSADTSDDNASAYDEFAPGSDSNDDLFDASTDSLPTASESDAPTTPDSAVCSVVLDTLVDVPVLLLTEGLAAADINDTDADDVDALVPGSPAPASKFPHKWTASTLFQPGYGPAFPGRFSKVHLGRLFRQIASWDGA